MRIKLGLTLQVFSILKIIQIKISKRILITLLSILAGRQITLGKVSEERGLHI